MTSKPPPGGRVATTDAAGLPADEQARGNVAPEPSDLQPSPDKPSEPSDWESVDVPGFAQQAPADDDSNWDVFLPDEEDEDPLPAPGDFWIETKETE